MFKKKPIIKYESATNFYDNVFSPAKKNIPEWYKKIPKFKNEKLFDFETQKFGSSIKFCMPFVESLTSGYMVTLPYDLFVTKNKNNSPFITWRVDDKYAPSWREVPADPNLVPFNHFDTEYTWKLGCSFNVPKGYSMLLTHPLNRYDLPFTTISGIIDGGYTTLYDGNVPFYIKKDFEGMIPQGTPIVQVIPFYNEEWSSKKEKGLLKESDENSKKAHAVFFGWYKKNYWVRKKYF
jgi:hypothetical protein